jgi:hypothetical protein
MKITFGRICATLLAPLVLTLGLSVPASAAPTPIFNSHYSGYSTTFQNNYHAVGPVFIVPTVDCRHSPNLYDVGVAAWVGLGGISYPHHIGSTLVQAGVGALCVSGFPVYGAVWQNVPKGEPAFLSHALWVCGGLLPTPLPGPLCSDPVKPGDTIYDSVDYLGNGNYVMSMNDTTQGWTWAKPLSIRDQEVPTTAEWVVEPVNTLANFGHVSFIDSSYSTGTTQGIFAGSTGSATSRPYIITADGTANSPQLTAVTPVGGPGLFSVTYTGPTSPFPFF